VLGHVQGLPAFAQVLPLDLGLLFVEFAFSVGLAQSLELPFFEFSAYLVLFGLVVGPCVLLELPLGLLLQLLQLHSLIVAGDSVVLSRQNFSLVGGYLVSLRIAF
jgi:hypothetical protein